MLQEKYKVFKYNKNVFFTKEANLKEVEGIRFSYMGRCLILVNSDLNTSDKQAVLHRLVKNIGDITLNKKRDGIKPPIN
ncbi:hypothetical protein [Hathewaya massiliensis]|uniref:hypothetical protein n=1 Tax=Hathewaya massiliensis TaxID=1964382 RepID=UPI0011583AD5|nr:hypothetical protein [Hathewaya massiliensis]